MSKAGVALDSILETMGRNSRLISMREWMANVREFLMNGPRDYLTVNDLYPTGFDGSTVVVTGSGPSLIPDGDDLINIKTTLIAGATNLPFLCQRDRAPDILVIADHNPVLWTLANEWKDWLRDTKIVLPFTVSPLWWQHPVNGIENLYYYKNIMQVHGQRPDEYTPNVMYVSLFPRGPFIMQAGCVTNAMLLLCDHLFDRWGIKRVVLAGVDYSVPADMAIPQRVPMSSPGSPEFDAAAFSPFYSNRKPFNKDFLVSMKDLSYAAATLAIRKEMQFDVFVSSAQTILYPYVDIRSIQTILGEDPASVRLASHVKLRQDELNESLDKFIQDTDPVSQTFLKELQDLQAKQLKTEVPGLKPEVTQA